MNRSKWDNRIHRADELAAKYLFATEVLHLYKRLAGFQKALYAQFEAACGKGLVKKLPGLLHHELDLPLLLPKFPRFLSDIETIVSQPLALSATGLNSGQAGRWGDLLTHCWNNVSEFSPALEQIESVVAWMFLQPYAEYLADHNELSPPCGLQTVCPFCSGRPLVGVLRQQGDGAKRSLICSVCSTEWEYGRIVCPACGEEAIDKLAIYTATQFTHVRIEGCETCGHYIKTVDLTKNGLAVPVVDELATIPLNLWAQEHGYMKLKTNLLGM